MVLKFFEKAPIRCQEVYTKTADDLASETSLVKIINTIDEFHRLTGPVMDLDFEFLDIVPSTRLGFFDRSRLSELVTFCKNNPEYHVISVLKQVPIKVNDVVRAAAFYMPLIQVESDGLFRCQRLT